MESEEQKSLIFGRTDMKIHIRVALFSVLAVAALSAAVGGAMVGSKSPGKWVQESNFAQVHTRCLAAFACVPATDVLHGADTVVKTTPSEPVWGVCNAAGGDIEGCNACSATVPSKACEYWLEKK